MNIQLVIASLLALAISATVVILLGVDRLAEYIDSELVPCRHGTAYADGSCDCAGSVFSGKYCSFSRCEQGEASRFQVTSPLASSPHWGCRCNPGWWGFLCSECTHADNSSCVGPCAEGWHGKDRCSTFCAADIAYAQLSSTAAGGECARAETNGGQCHLCSGHGHCGVDGGCVCDDEWFDSLDVVSSKCSRTCDGGCGGHGRCAATSADAAHLQCVCDEGFVGVRCDIPLTCVHGVAVIDYAENTATCRCATPMWTGAACDVRCVGDGRPCNGHGACQSDGSCVCDAGWDELLTCTCNDAASCGGHGSCAATDDPGVHMCLCDVEWDGSDDCSVCGSGYLGSRCQFAAPDCGAHGEAVVIDSGKIDERVGCRCADNFAGDRCETCRDAFYPLPTVTLDSGELARFNIDGFCQYPVTAAANCHGKGQPNAAFGAAGQEPCVCDGNFDASTGCSRCDADYYTSTCNIFCDAASTCSGHGQCHPATGLCDCDEGFSGEACDRYCPHSCSGHGECRFSLVNQTLATCACADGFFGDACGFHCPHTPYGVADCNNLGPCLMKPIVSEAQTFPCFEDADCGTPEATRGLVSGLLATNLTFRSGGTLDAEAQFKLRQIVGGDPEWFASTGPVCRRDAPVSADYECAGTLAFGAPSATGVGPFHLTFSQTEFMFPAYALARYVESPVAVGFEGRTFYVAAADHVNRSALECSALPDRDACADVPGCDFVDVCDYAYDVDAHCAAQQIYGAHQDCDCAFVAAHNISMCGVELSPQCTDADAALQAWQARFSEMPFSGQSLETVPFDVARFPTSTANVTETCAYWAAEHLSTATDCGGTSACQVSCASDDCSANATHVMCDGVVRATCASIEVCAPLLLAREPALWTQETTPLADAPGTIAYRFKRTAEVSATVQLRTATGDVVFSIYVDDVVRLELSDLSHCAADDADCFEEVPRNVWLDVYVDIDWSNSSLRLSFGEDLAEVVAFSPVTGAPTFQLIKTAGAGVFEDLLVMKPTACGDCENELRMLASASQAQTCAALSSLPLPDPAYADAPWGDICGYFAQMHQSQTKQIFLHVSVINVNGQNRFAFNGTVYDSFGVDAPATMIFNITDVPSHPFRVSSTEDGTHNGGTALQVDQTVHQLTVDIHSHSLPIYFYCDSHPNMGGVIEASQPMSFDDTKQCLEYLPYYNASLNCSGRLDGCPENNVAEFCDLESQLTAAPSCWDITPEFCAKLAANEVQGQCSKLYCDCGGASVSGPACDLTCPINPSDGSPCGVASGLGTCVVSDLENKTLRSATRTLKDGALVAGTCRCFSSGAAPGTGCEVSCVAGGGCSDHISGYETAWDDDCGLGAEYGYAAPRHNFSEADFAFRFEGGATVKDAATGAVVAAFAANASGTVVHRDGVFASDVNDYVYAASIDATYEVSSGGHLFRVALPEIEAYSCGGGSSRIDDINCRVHQRRNGTEDCDVCFRCKLPFPVSQCNEADGQCDCLPPKTVVRRVHRKDWKGDTYVDIERSFDAATSNREAMMQGPQAWMIFGVEYNGTKATGDTWQPLFDALVADPTSADFSCASGNCAYEIMLLGQLEATSNRFGMTCDKICPGTVGDIPCSGHGRCTPVGTCQCDPLYASSFARQRLGDSTVGITKTVAYVSGYRGADCSKTCPGYAEGQPLSSICSGHGVCDDDAKCQCQENWAGDDCSLACPYTPGTQQYPGRECSGHGVCDVAILKKSTFPKVCVGPCAQSPGDCPAATSDICCPGWTRAGDVCVQGCVGPCSSADGNAFVCSITNGKPCCEGWQAPESNPHGLCFRRDGEVDYAITEAWQRFYDACPSTSVTVDITQPFDAATKGGSDCQVPTDKTVINITRYMDFDANRIELRGLADYTLAVNGIFQAHPIIGDDWNMLTADCQCFREPDLGYWARASCVTCLRPYGTRQCNKICPGITDSDTYCHGDGTCLWGSENGLGVDFYSSSCSCGKPSSVEQVNSKIVSNYDYYVKIDDHAWTNLVFEQQVQNFHFQDRECFQCETSPEQFSGFNCAFRCQLCLFQGSGDSSGCHTTSTPDDFGTSVCSCNSHGQAGAMDANHNCCPVGTVMGDLKCDDTQTGFCQPFEAVVDSGGVNVLARFQEITSADDAYKSQSKMCHVCPYVVPSGLSVATSEQFFFKAITGEKIFDTIGAAVCNGGGCRFEAGVTKCSCEGASNPGGLYCTCSELESPLSSGQSTRNYLWGCGAPNLCKCIPGQDALQCNGGRYFAGVDQGCLECPVGWASGRSDYGSGACVECGAGKYAFEAFDFCTACPTGQFNQQNGQQYCKVCPEGFYQDQQGTEDCKQCGAGTYQPSTDATGCDDCPAGQFQDQTHQSGCKECSLGWYQSQTGQISCNQCIAGHYSDNRIQCIPCGPGKFSGAGSHVCDNCPSGQYVDSNSASRCNLCPRGEYQDQVGETGCKVCPLGRANNELGQSECPECVAGKFQIRDPFKCTDCPSGFFNNDMGETDCAPCIGNTYQNNQGQTTCLECPSGQQPTGADWAGGNNGCVDCQAGQYSSSSVNGVCNVCSGNQYQDQTGQDDCKDCPEGWWNPDGQTTYGWTSCETCYAPQYLVNEGGYFCQECPDGWYQFADHQTFCIMYD